MSETIIALATPPGVGALAVLRISGPESKAVAGRLLRGDAEWIPRQSRHVVLWDGETRLDDVVLTWWKAPHSYTGEDAVEISCHGNPLLVQKILGVFLRAGVRPAQPGEFTERAFLNGKLDLTQAEAVLDVISAGSDYALEGAQSMQMGLLAQTLKGLREQLIQVLAHLEAYIDFPEEDISPETGGKFIQRVTDSLTEVRRLLATASTGRILREGVLTAIVGEPNVGKSSLLNALLRENRAIVSPLPGTTRDVIEAECRLRGLRLRLLDTAGHRETADAIEAEGVRRADEALAHADLIIHVVEAPAAAVEMWPGLESARKGHAYVRVANKADLGVHPGHQESVAVSAQTGKGLDALEDAIERAVLQVGQVENHGWLTVNARHEAALRKAEAALERVQAALVSGEPPELVSVDLRGVLDSIGDIIGLTTNEDILDQIFKNFCIGK